MKRRGLEPSKRVAYFEYDFARDGGAVGTIAMRGDALPDDAVVTNGKIQVQTALTSSGSATAAIQLLSAGDVLAATAKASFTANAILDIVPVSTAATCIRTTSAGLVPSIVIAVAALTAGKITLALEYL